MLGLVLALAGFLAGRSESAVRIRRWSADRLHSIRGGPAAGGPVATWVRAHIRGLRIGAVALAVLAFVFLEQPTGATILIIAALLLVVLAVIEFLGRPETPPRSTTGRRGRHRACRGRGVPVPGPASRGLTWTSSRRRTPAW